MDIQDCFAKYKEIYEQFIAVIEGNCELNEFYPLLANSIILDSKDGIKEILSLISKVTNNHSRTENFFDTIDQILIYLKPKIEQNFSNIDVFQITKENKRLLLSLVELKLLTLDEIIIKEMSKFPKYNYFHFFYPEIKEFIDAELKKNIEKDLKELDLNPGEFESIRKIGENHSKICSLIRNDSIEEFISYLNFNNINYSMPIKPSIFETHPYLIENNLNVIEYACFFGSYQIFKYFAFDKSFSEIEWDGKMKRKYLVITIYSQNSELISIIQEKCENLPYIFFEDCMNISIKCHHNDIGNYFINQFLISEESLLNSYIVGIENFNFDFFPQLINSSTSFFYFCQFDHSIFVKLLLKDKDLNINQVVVFFVIIINSVLKLLYLREFSKNKIFK